MGREQTSLRQLGWEKVQGISVDHHRNAFSHPLRESVGVVIVSVPTRSNNPGLDASLTNNNGRSPAQQEGHDGAGSGKSHHSWPGAQRSKNAKHSRPRKPLGSGIDADDPAGVFVVARAGDRPQRCHLSEVAVLVDTIERPVIIVDKVKADVMNLQLAAIAGGRVSNMTPLEAGKSNGVSGMNTGLHLTRIRIQTRWHIDCEQRDPASTQPGVDSL